MISRKCFLDNTDIVIYLSGLNLRQQINVAKGVQQRQYFLQVFRNSEEKEFGKIFFQKGRTGSSSSSSCIT